MPLIDESLDEFKIPISKRLMLATGLFVAECVRPARADDGSWKSDFAGSDLLLKTIIPTISDWLWAKYGELCKSDCDETLSGILCSYAQPLLIKIPITIRRVEMPGKSAWFTFPDQLREDESIQAMVGNALNLQIMEEKQRNDLREEARNVVALTRSINLNLTWIGAVDDRAFSVAATIWAHFEQAIDGILSFRAEHAATACWDLNFALEKCFKVFLRSKGEAPPHTHDLKRLSKLAAVHGLFVSDALLRQLPNDREAIQLRYPELSMDTLTATSHYKAALSLAEQITSMFPRSVTMNNASLLIAAAPWAR